MDKLISLQPTNRQLERLPIKTQLDLIKRRLKKEVDESWVEQSQLYLLKLKFVPNHYSYCLDVLEVAVVQAMISEKSRYKALSLF